MFSRGFWARGRGLSPLEPSKSLLERLNFDDGLRGPSRVRGGYEDALTQFLVFCGSPVMTNLPVYDSACP